MRKTRRIPAVAAAFACSAMLLCSSAAVAFAEAPDAAEIPGTYRAEYDIMEMIGPQMEESGMKLEGELPLAFTMELKDDNTFSLDMEADEFVETLQKVFEEQGPDMIRGLLEEQGVTEEMFDQVADQFGVDSFDEFVDSMVDEMVKGIADEMAGSLDEEVSISGTYAVDGNEITFTAEEEKTEAAASSTSEEAVSGTSEESLFASEEKATIDEDGAIHMEVPVEEDQKLELIFVKQ